MTTTTAADARAPLFDRLWFVWALAVHLVVVSVLWVPTMLDLALRPTVRTFRRWARPWSRAALALSGARVERSGAVPAGPVVYVANHQAMLDVPVLLVAIPAPFLFVARASLARLPLIGAVLRASVCVLLDRSAPGGAQAALDEAAERLALGESVLFFPEGTRRPDARLGPFFPGAFRLARQAGLPVVPVALGDTHALASERLFTARPGTVRVRVGDPISPAGFADDEALAAAARGAVDRMMASV